MHTSYFTTVRFPTSCIAEDCIHESGSQFPQIKTAQIKTIRWNKLITRIGSAR